MSRMIIVVPVAIRSALCRAALPLLLLLHAAAHAQPEMPANAVTSAQAATAAPSDALPPMASTPAPTSAAPSTARAVEGPSFAPMGVALLVVLGLMAAVLWLLRRAGLAPRAGSGNLLRLVGQLSLGPRERVVVIEAGDRWLLLGVGTAGISRLGTLPKGESPSVPAPMPSFGVLLDKLRKGAAQ